ncbi:MAG TPA: hypothetical protein VG815_14450, partial [Chloroflexota bacterium]|nr:hypothetical protein [Chloroflexota bacterium]
GPSLDNAFQDFGGDPQKIYEQIMVGGESTSYQYMPAFGSILSATQGQDIVQFLKEVPAAEAKLPSRGNSPPWVPIGAAFAFFALAGGWILWPRKRGGVLTEPEHSVAAAE